ncbi:MAG TPA: MAPEG family protein [Casimicrobiaceae bacterium]|nr:MAPEG family protein [Casimicrobiaceae bacterium]
MKPELTYLALVTALTGLMWIPYVLNRIAVWGVPDTVGYPQTPKPQAAWALRMKAAHANAVENLVVFAALVLVASIAGISNGATMFAAALYFWSRLVHVIAYTFAVPWVRTLAFAGGFVAQATFALQILVR